MMRNGFSNQRINDVFANPDLLSGGDYRTLADRHGGIGDPQFGDRPGFAFTPFDTSSPSGGGAPRSLVIDPQKFFPRNATPGQGGSPQDLINFGQGFDPFNPLAGSGGNRFSDGGLQNGIRNFGSGGPDTNLSPDPGPTGGETTPGTPGQLGFVGFGDDPMLRFEGFGNGPGNVGFEGFGEGPGSLGFEGFGDNPTLRFEGFGQGPGNVGFEGFGQGPGELGFAGFGSGPGSLGFEGFGSGPGNVGFEGFGSGPGNLGFVGFGAGPGSLGFEGFGQGPGELGFAGFGQGPGELGFAGFGNGPGNVGLSPELLELVQGGGLGQNFGSGLADALSGGININGLDQFTGAANNLASSGGIDDFFNDLFGITDRFSGPDVNLAPGGQLDSQARLINQIFGFDFIPRQLPPEATPNIGQGSPGNPFAPVINQAVTDAEGRVNNFADVPTGTEGGPATPAGGTKTFTPPDFSESPITDDRSLFRNALTDQLLGNTGAQDLLGKELTNAIGSEDPFASGEGSILADIMGQIDRQAEEGRERLLNQFAVTNKLDQGIFKENLQDFESGVLDTQADARINFGLERARSSEATRRNRLGDLQGFNQGINQNLGQALSQSQGNFAQNVAMQDQASSNALQRFIDETAFNNAVEASRTGFSDNGLNLALSFLSGQAPPANAGNQAASIFGNIANQQNTAQANRNTSDNNLFGMLTNPDLFGGGNG
jgi:hypothetical protein